MHIAVVKNHLEVVKYLLEQDFPVNQEDRNGTTAIILAASINKPQDARQFCQILIDNRAQIDHVNTLGHSALSIAIQTGNNDLL